MKKLLLVSAVATMCSSMSVSAHNHSSDSHNYVVPLPKSSMEALCYLKAEDTQASYHYKASLYGLSRFELKSAEQSYICDNGQRLGDIENRWKQ